jgi:hypothetical protein
VPESDKAVETPGIWGDEWDAAGIWGEKSKMIMMGAAHLGGWLCQFLQVSRG